MLPYILILKYFIVSAQTLHHILEQKYEGVVWPSTQVSRQDLLSWILKRINEVSSLYQMFGMLGDVFAFRKYDNINNNIITKINLLYM